MTKVSRMTWVTRVTRVTDLGDQGEQDDLGYKDDLSDQSDFGDQGDFDEQGDQDDQNDQGEQDDLGGQGDWDDQGYKGNLGDYDDQGDFGDEVDQDDYSTVQKQVDSPLQVSILDSCANKESRTNYGESSRGSSLAGQKTKDSPITDFSIILQRPTAVTQHGKVIFAIRERDSMLERRPIFYSSYKAKCFFKDICIKLHFLK